MIQSHIPDVYIICASRLEIECLLGQGANSSDIDTYIWHNIYLQTGNFGLVYKGRCRMAAHHKENSFKPKQQKTYQMTVAIKSIKRKK